MRSVKTLDCTLRDGGYCNSWKFGKHNIDKVIKGLIESKVDYIECGYVSSFVDNNKDSTKFYSFELLNNIIPIEKSNTKCLVMVNYGEVSLAQIPLRKESNVDGIRVAFHRDDWEKALLFCEQIQEKGYDVFVQPMVSMCYSDEEYSRLIERVNKFNPYAFYIVDSFGMMKRNDVLHFAQLVEEKMNTDIMLGFHAHNNLQLAFANAQCLVELPFRREIIVDVSVHGMGRGAGNLNSELFLDYLNSVMEKTYNIKALLNLMDEVISPFYERHSWGYSLPNYLSATHAIHPNYAYYLSKKKTLTLEVMDELFELIEMKKRYEYDEQYIEQLYVGYLSKRKDEYSTKKPLGSIVAKDITGLRRKIR